VNVGNLALRFFGVLIGVRGVSRTGGGRQLPVGCPLTVTLPPVGLSRPRIVRIVVGLPTPWPRGVPEPYKFS